MFRGPGQDLEPWQGVGRTLRGAAGQAWHAAGSPPAPTGLDVHWLFTYGEGCAMAQVRRCHYYYVTVQDQPGEGFRLFRRLAGLGVNLLAFTGVPVGPSHTQFTLFPEDEGKLKQAAAQSSMALDGPHAALLVQGDDQLGALAEIHERLFEADVNVYASSGVTDGKGSFGYMVYVRPTEIDRAAQALGTLMSSRA